MDPQGFKILFFSSKSYLQNTVNAVKTIHYVDLDPGDPQLFTKMMHVILKLPYFAYRSS